MATVKDAYLSIRLKSRTDAWDTAYIYYYFDVTHK